MQGEYFIPIYNEERSPIQIDKWIKELRKNNKTTPQFTLQILEQTNHIANLKPIIKEIQKLPKEEQLKYKEFVLSAISHRIQSEQITKALVQMALDGEYIQEFMDTNRYPKFYFPYSCKVTNIRNFDHENTNFSQYDTLISYNSKTNNTNLELARCTLPTYVSLPNLHHLRLVDNNYDKLKTINIENVERISFEHQSTYRLPEKLDLSPCCRATFFECDLTGVKSIITSPKMILEIKGGGNLPEQLYFKDLKSVAIHSCFRTTKELYIENSQSVSLNSSTRVPQKITIKNCESVRMDAIDFDIKELNLENIQYISLCEKKFKRGDSKENPPEILDLSSCKEIRFQNFPLSKIKELKFGKHHTVVALEYALSMPKVLDLRGAKKVILNYANCYGLKEIKFAKGSVVHLTGAYNLPKKLDISMCNCVDMFDCDLTNVEEITFLNEEQKEVLISSNQTFNGKIKYSTSTISPIQNNDFTI